MNTDLIKQTTLEDYQRRLDNVLVDVTTLENEPTGLYKRILNTDRQLLFGCMGKVLNVSQSSILHNRDELSFFESLHHLFHYYMYDDGTLTIEWEKYSLTTGTFRKCKEGKGSPFLTYMRDECGGFKLARQKEIHWLIDWHEAEHNRRKNYFISDDVLDEEEIKEFDTKEYINYGMDSGR